MTSEEWWLDPSTRNFIYGVFEPDKTITFTVCESRPLKLNGAEVSLESHSPHGVANSIAADLPCAMMQLVADKVFEWFLQIAALTQEQYMMLFKVTHGHGALLRTPCSCRVFIGNIEVTNPLICCADVC